MGVAEAFEVCVVGQYMQAVPFFSGWDLTAYVWVAGVAAPLGSNVFEFAGGLLLLLLTATRNRGKEQALVPLHARRFLVASGSKSQCCSGTEEP